MNRCLESSQSDYIEFSNFNVPLTDRKMPRLCGAGSSYSILSDGTFFRVTFVSNDIFDGTGFSGRYEFQLHHLGTPSFTTTHLIRDSELHVGLVYPWIRLGSVSINGPMPNSQPNMIPMQCHVGLHNGVRQKADARSHEKIACPWALNAGE